MNSKNQQNVEPQQKKRRPRPDEIGEVRLRSERVQEELRRMQGWKLVAAGRAIGRKWHFPEPKVAAAYVAYVAELAATVHHPVRIHLNGEELTVTVTGRVRNGAAEGLTRQAFQFAQNLV